MGRLHVASWLLVSTLCASAHAQLGDPSVPQETPDVRMPAGDAARGIPMPAGTFDQEVYRARRQRLMEQLDGDVAVVFGATSIGAHGAQDADFYNLTGLAQETGAALLLAPSEPVHKEFLFLRGVNPEQNRWNGERAILGRGIELGTGFARVYRTSRLGSTLALTGVHAEKFVFLGPIVGYDKPIPKALQVCKDASARLPGVGVRMDHRLLRRMRQNHDEAELDLMRQAIACTGSGLEAAMCNVRAGMSEFELKQVIERGFRDAGSRRNAFDSIVASGPNGAVLHYPNDSRLMQAGELVLCDVGAEIEHYASDVTRTFPVSGRFTPRQREVYEVVLRAQQAAIDATRAGVRLREDIHEAARRVIEQAGFTDDFFHGTSHFVGLEVHDAGLSDEPLPAGTVITIEPGIYLADEALGIRIEDEVLITEDGCVVLTEGIPRSIDAIERLMARCNSRVGGPTGESP